MEAEEVFGPYKKKGESIPKSKGDSQRHNYVNFFHPRVNHAIAKSNVQIEQLGADQIHGDVEILEAPCGDGILQIERCHPMSHV
jgi:hypothetical protein